MSTLIFNFNQSFWVLVCLVMNRSDDELYILQILFREEEVKKIDWEENKFTDLSIWEAEKTNLHPTAIPKILSTSSKEARKRSWIVQYRSFTYPTIYLY